MINIELFTICTGRREIGYIGGGLPVVWHMTDCVRITKNEQDPKVEVVKEIIPEQTRLVCFY